MAHRRGSRFPTRSGQRRQTSWGVGPQDVDGGFSASGSSLWSSGIIPLVEGLTIVRIRGVVKVTNATAGVALDGFFGAHGMCIVTNEAFAVGITAVPTPLDDEDWDGWMWHSYFDVRAPTATFADGVNAGAIYSNIEIDSKSMRKIPDGYTLVGVTEVVESGTATCEVQSQTRILFKLP